MRVLDGKSSREVPVNSGVPQCTVLVPLLFLCHINDLPASVKSQVRLFADDWLLYRGIKTFSDHTTLQNAKRLEKWVKDWGMSFDTKDWGMSFDTKDWGMSFSINNCYILGIKNNTDFFYSLNNVIL